MVALVLATPAEPASERAWRIHPLPVAPEGASAVAALAGRQAVGDARGVVVRVAEERWSRVALRGGVRDLAWAEDGGLWIATGEGLLRLLGGRLEERSPAPGDVNRNAMRVAVAHGSVAVATEGGVFWSRDGLRFERVEGLFGESASSGLAFAARDSAPSDSPPVPAPSAGASAVLWIAAERGLFRAALPPDGVAQRVRAERVELPVDLRPALDVRVERGRVLALGRQALVESDGPGRAWLAHWPELPPGAVPTALEVAGDGLWIATDRGLATAPAPAGPWTRAPAPAGATPIFAVVEAGAELLAATSRGLLVGAREPGAEIASTARDAAPPVASPPAAAACDPTIADVQRAVLAYADLRGDRVATLWWGVRRRALLPDLVLEADYARDTGGRHAYDESFVSGDTRHLYDSDRFRDRGRDLAVALRWTLGDLLYHDEQIDVSNEARRVIELRDDVLDEVNQLYFDRRRALAAAAALAGSPEAESERLRAEELAAGLDGWTGGWFGTRAGAQPCPPVGP
jgi:hypothetical protein